MVKQSLMMLLIMKLTSRASGPSLGHYANVDVYKAGNQQSAEAEDVT